MKAKITAKDKNVMTFTLAILTLSVIILGISFRYSDKNPDVVHSMDVILAKKSNFEAPEEADYLAEKDTPNNKLKSSANNKPNRPIIV